jgi:hypothetical protein
MESIFITTKDVMRWTGLQRDAAYNMIAQVRNALGKKKYPNGRYQRVTRREFCEFHGIDRMRENIT